MHRVKEVIMKLKHRKLVLIISMSAMGIGLITFSIAGSKEKKDTAVEGLQISEASDTEGAKILSADETTNTPTPTEETTGTPTPTEEPTDTPTNPPTPTEAAVPLEEDAYPEVNELITSFLQAKLDGKAKKLKKLVTDPSYIDIDDIQKKTEFIESYDNVKVYTKKGSGDIDFIAYVYMDVKIASIDTKAPGLNEFYIKKVDGEYKIVLGDISDETAAYIEEARTSEDVQTLLEKVNKKLNKAMKSDEELADFCSKLEVASTSDSE